MTAHFILYVSDQQRSTAFYAAVLARAPRELSALAPRDWGHRAAYSLDPDGHVLAFAEKL